MVRVFMCNTVELPRVLTCMLFNKFHRLFLQETPSQDFIKRLNERRFGDGFKWDGRLF